MKKEQHIIYIRLLGEGTEVFRPVSAFNVGECIYVISDLETSDQDDEIWEFEPGTTVAVEPRILSPGGEVLVAVKRYESPA